MAQVRSIPFKPQTPTFHHYTGPPNPKKSKQRPRTGASRHVTFCLSPNPADTGKVGNIEDSTSAHQVTSNAITVVTTTSDAIPDVMAEQAILRQTFDSENGFKDIDKLFNELCENTRKCVSPKSNIDANASDNPAHGLLDTVITEQLAEIPMLDLTESRSYKEDDSQKTSIGANASATIELDPQASSNAILGDQNALIPPFNLSDEAHESVAGDVAAASNNPTDALVTGQTPNLLQNKEHEEATDTAVIASVTTDSPVTDGRVISGALPVEISTQVANKIDRCSTRDTITCLSKSMKRRRPFDSTTLDTRDPETRRKRHRQKHKQRDEGDDADQYENDGVVADNHRDGNRRKFKKWGALDDARLLAWQRENKSPKWMAKQLQGAWSQRAISKQLRTLKQIAMQEDQMWFDVEEVLDSKIEDGVKKFCVRWVDSWIEEQDIDPDLIRRFEEGN